MRGKVKYCHIYQQPRLFACPFQSSLFYRIYSPAVEQENAPKDDDSLLSPIKKSSSKGRKKRMLESSDEEDVENETLNANKKSPTPTEKKKLRKNTK